MTRSAHTRRRFLTWTASASSGLIFAAWGSAGRAAAGLGTQTKEEAPAAEGEDRPGPEVTATEDLMREHGVLRRCLLVYLEAATRLRHDAASVPPVALQSTAKLFRSFGEDYHERKLEEAHIFPSVKRSGGPAAIYPDILVAQHHRGREITEFVISQTSGHPLGTRAPMLSGALESFARMYQNHAAREDTIVFPAWKATLSRSEYEELGEQFEEIEQQEFGEDGYEAAVRQIGDIEASLGLSDLAQFTAPPPVGK
jgi:hemerythrin-like domain-containing protein